MMTRYVFNNLPAKFQPKQFLIQKVSLKSLLHKKPSFSLSISLVNATKSTKNLLDSITFTKEILNGNLHFNLVPSAFYTARQSVNATKDNENSQNVALW